MRRIIHHPFFNSSAYCVVDKRGYKHYRGVFTTISKLLRSYNNLSRMVYYSHHLTCSQIQWYTNCPKKVDRLLSKTIQVRYLQGRNGIRYCHMPKPTYTRQIHFHL